MSYFGDFGSRQNFHVLQTEELGAGRFLSIPASSSLSWPVASKSEKQKIPCLGRKTTTPNGSLCKGLELKVHQASVGLLNHNHSFDLSLSLNGIFSNIIS